MKALVYHGPRDLRYEEVATPAPKNGEVLVKVRAVSICGSDLSGYKGGSAMRVAPLIMGHEFSGEIAVLGQGVTGMKVGDRVGVVTSLYCGKCQDCKDGLDNVCDNRYIIGTTMKAGSYNGAMADYVLAPAEKIMPLPAHVSFNACAMVEPLSISLRATKHLGDIKGKTVAVVGGGDAAVEGAAIVAQVTKKLYVIHRRKEFKAEPYWVEKLKEKTNVTFVLERQVREITGDAKVTALVLDQPFEGSDRLAVDGVFVEIGATPAVEMAQSLGCALDERGYLKVDAAQQTSVPGAFAAGDVSGASNHFAQFVTAAGEGAVAVSGVFSYLQR